MPAPIRALQIFELGEAFESHGVRYLFIGKSGAILHGFPDTTQDADLFVERDPENGRAAVEALRFLGFDIDETLADAIESGKDFVHIRSGNYDVDLIFAPDGIESFAGAWRRGRRIETFNVCALDDIIASKEAAGRTKDRESLPRLKDFRSYLQTAGTATGAPLPPLGGRENSRRANDEHER